MSKRKAKAARNYAVFWQGVRVWTVRGAASEHEALMRALHVTARAVTVVPL